jgi:TIR domain-containing protein
MEQPGSRSWLVSMVKSRPRCTARGRVRRRHERTRSLLDPTYDVFLSVAGADREPGRVLATELRALGLRVFVDEDGIEPFTGITSGIWNALGAAKCLVAYYSAEYAARPSCQRELMAAYLAGQREGDPCGRILVINPERETRHVRPVELADAKFAQPSLGVAEIAQLVAKRAAAIGRPIGEVQSSRSPRLSARLSGYVRNLVGRYAELWDLHTSLFGTDYPLIEESACGPFSSVYGLPGSGKTALVATYAWRFAAAFPGGVSWLTLAGADADSAASVLRERYASELRRVAHDLGVGVDTVPDSRIVGTVVRALRDAEAATLWIVDDIPDGVDAETLLDTLPLVADSGARTVLISDGDIFRDLLPGVRVGALPHADAATLLDRYRCPESEPDKIARDEVIDAFGGNAAALVAVGRYLRDRHGLISYPSIIGEARYQEHVADVVFERIRRAVGRLRPPELALLRLVGELDGFTFPVGRLAAMPRLAGIDVTGTLESLLASATVSRTGVDWRFDPLVVHAVCGVR